MNEDIMLLRRQADTRYRRAGERQEEIRDTVAQ